MAFSGRVSPRATTESRVDVAPVTRTDDARLPPRRRRTVAAVISVVAVALALGTVGLFWRAGTQSKEVHGALPSAGTSDARTRGRAITDHPPPRTKSPEAAAAYASALQDARDGSLAMASDELLRASKLDPTFAAASLRIVLLTRGGDLTEAREAFAAASRSRGSLDERDLLLLHAAEAQTGDPVDWSELAARLEATLDRFPDDAETLWHLGCAQEKVHDIAAARASEDRALMVDPQFAGALWAIGRMYMDVEEYDQGLPVLERCLEVSPSAASCLRVRSVIHRERGQCADFEADARRMTVVEPRGVKAYEYLASAIATRGAPLESVHAALDKAVSLQAEIDSAQAAVDRKTNELLLGALTGDIPSAASAARELDRLATDRTTESEHASSALALIDIFEEQGQPAKALAVAEDFERKLPAWTADAPLVIRSYLLYARHHAGLADDSFKRMREALLRETLRGVAPLDAPTLTFRLYSLWAKTPDEVADALTFVGALPPGLSEPEALASVGKMYFLAGQPDEAIPPLRRAAASCELLSRYVPLFHDQRVHVLLGEALEAKGEKEGACEAYRVVLDLWKDAKGRSITLEKAKERSRALRCGH